MNKAKVLKRKQSDWNSNGSSIEILEISDWDSDIKQYGINWSALGTVKLERARKFNNSLNECLAIVNQMNQFALSEQGDGGKDEK